jgi:hypothetical protein
VGWQGSMKPIGRAGLCSISVLERGDLALDLVNCAKEIRSDVLGPGTPSQCERKSSFACSSVEAWPSMRTRPSTGPRTVTDQNQASSGREGEESS